MRGGGRGKRDGSEKRSGIYLEVLLFAEPLAEHLANMACRIKPDYMRLVLLFSSLFYIFYYYIILFFVFCFIVIHLLLFLFLFVIYLAMASLSTQSTWGIIFNWS